MAIHVETVDEAKAVEDAVDALCGAIYRRDKANGPEVAYDDLGAVLSVLTSMRMDLRRRIPQEKW